MWNGVIMLKKYNIVNNVFLNGILCKIKVLYNVFLSSFIEFFGR